MTQQAPTKARPLKGVVVGAGLAGLTFARMLRDKYPRVDLEVFERRNRLGGRVYTDRKLERGAEFINGDHYSIQQWCQRLKVPLIPSYIQTDAAPKLATLRNGKLRTDFKELITQLKTKVLLDRERIKRDPAYKKELNQTPASEYVERLSIPKEDMDTLMLFLETEQGVRPQKMSASFLVEFMDFEQLDPESNSLFVKGDDLYKIENGSSSLINALAKDLHYSIHKDRALTQITKTPAGRYRVFAEGLKPRNVDFVVFALPAQAVKGIKFGEDDSALSDLRRKLLSLRYSKIEKTIVEIAGEPSSVLDHYQQILSHETRALVWKTGPAQEASQRSHIAVYRGGSNIGYGGMKAIKALARDLSATSRPIDNRRHRPSEVIDATAELWPEGGYSQPVLGRGPEFSHNTPVSVGANFFIIGEHMAKIDPQTMQGAVESAERGFEEFEKLMLPRLYHTR